MVNIYSKIKLSEDIKGKVLHYVNSLDKSRKYESEGIKYHIDTNIISGIRVNIDSEIFDLTLNNRLEKILELLK